jgi:hypothetical protein
MASKFFSFVAVPQPLLLGSLLIAFLFLLSISDLVFFLLFVICRHLFTLVFLFLLLLFGAKFSYCSSAFCRLYGGSVTSSCESFCG